MRFSAIRACVLALGLIVAGACFDSGSTDGCRTDADCLTNRLCVDGSCVPTMPELPPPVDGCSDDDSCGEGAACVTEINLCACPTRFAACADTCCLYEHRVVDMRGEDAMPARALDLAVDAANYAHVVYTVESASGRTQLHYAHEDHLGWHTEMIDEQVGSETAPALALDDDGVPHVLYEADVTELYYAFRQPDGTWAVDDVNETASGTSVVIDIVVRGSVGIDLEVHIAVTTAIAVSYYHGGPGQWLREGIDFGVASVLALNSFGTPEIAYYNDRSDVTLTLAQRVGPNEWEKEIIEEGLAYPLLQPALVFDDDGEPHILFASGDGNALRYAHRGSGKWQIWASGEFPGRPYYPALALQGDTIAIATTVLVDDIPRVMLHVARAGANGFAGATFPGVNSTLDPGIGLHGVGVGLRMQPSPSGELVLAYGDLDLRALTVGRLEAAAR